MKRRSTIEVSGNFGLIVCVLAIILWGCAGPGADRMIPFDTPIAKKTISKTVRVGPVSGEVKERYNANAKNTQIRDVIVKSLEHSKHFMAVVLEGQSDLELRATIIDQRRKGDIPMSNEIIINYKLIENESGSILWQETIQSMAGSNAPGGADRLRKSCEGAVRENIALFISELSSDEWK
jgi:hypothetical protein